MTERIEGTTLVVGAASTIGSVVIDHLDGKTERLFSTWHEKEPQEQAGQKSF